MRYSILISSMILALAATAAAETYVVNPEGTGDFPTIQAAIDMDGIPQGALGRAGRHRLHDHRSLDERGTGHILHTLRHGSCLVKSNVANVSAAC